MIRNENTRAFVLCAGSGSRWGEYLNVPKQLISFNGESLISRIVRQLKQNGVADVFIVSGDTRLSNHGAKLIKPSNSDLLIDTILSTKNYWVENNLMLLGDVFFTDMAMSKITNSSKSIVFFGRPWASKLIKCNHGELFALKFNSGSVFLIEDSANFISTNRKIGLRGNLWDLYHTLAGIPYNSGRAVGGIFLVIDDITNDFDSPSDFERRKYIYQQLTSRFVVKKWILISWLLCKLPFHLISRKPVAVK